MHMHMHMQVNRPARHEPPQVYDSRAHGDMSHQETGSTFELPCGSDDVPLLIQGNTKVTFYDRDKMSKDDTMFSFWIHTGCIEPGMLVLRRPELDKACKKKMRDKFPDDFALEIETENYSRSSRPGGSWSGHSMDDFSEDDDISDDDDH